MKHTYNHCNILEDNENIHLIVFKLFTFDCNKGQKVLPNLSLIFFKEIWIIEFKMTLKYNFENLIVAANSCNYRLLRNNIIATIMLMILNYSVFI